MNSNESKVLAQCASLLQLTGFQYFSINNLNKEKDRKFPTFFYNIYFVVLIIIIPVVLMYFSIIINENQEENLNVKTIFSQFIQNLMSLGFIGVSITGLVSSYLKTNKMKKFFLNFQSYREISNQVFSKGISYKNLRTHIFGNFIGTVSFLIVSEILKEVMNPVENDKLALMKSILVQFPLFICFMATQAILYHVIIINEHLKHLNSILEEILHQEILTKEQKSSKVLVKVSAAKKLLNIISKNSDIINKHKRFSILSVFIFNCLVCVALCNRVIISVLGIKTGKSGKKLSNVFGIKKLIQIRK